MSANLATKVYPEHGRRPRAKSRTLASQNEAPPNRKELILSRDLIVSPLSCDPVDSSSSGWDQAVCAAAAMLNDSWILPETRCQSAGTGLEEELAAFLCAFGALA